MTIANGIFKQVRYKRQVTFGAPITGATGGKLMRRVTSDLDLSKNTYRSNEIRPSQQRGDMRHGTRMVKGKIAGELSIGTHADFFESFCRQAWQTPATTGAQTTIAAAPTTLNMGTYTRSAGSFITDGFKAGDVLRATGFTTTGVNNNARNQLVLIATATVLTVLNLDGTPVATKTAGDSVTLALPGKKTWIPQSGHTNDCYTIEHWFSDIGQSEVFDSCRVANVDIGLPATGMATCDITFAGRDMLTAQAAYFTSPAAAPAGRSLAAVNGALIVNGAVVALLTGLTIAGNANATTGEVVGSNTTPDVFVGAVDVTGQATAYFLDGVLRDMFINETEASILCALTSDNTANASFIAFSMPRVKFGGATKDDGEKGLILTMPYTALENDIPATGTLPTTLAIQDSSIT